MNRPKIALFDLDGTLADYDGQLLKDLQRIASPHEPPPVLYQDIPYLEARRFRYYALIIKNLLMKPFSLDLATMSGYTIHLISYMKRIVNASLAHYYKQQFYLNSSLRRVFLFFRV